MIAPVEERGAHSPFSNPRDFLDNRFVYVTVSPRAKGLSVGVNLCPDKACNFDCVYCEVNRAISPRDQTLDVEVMGAELESTLGFIQQGRLPLLPQFRSLPQQLLKLKHVCLSGDGEPTLCPNFLDAVQKVLQVRALGTGNFFKVGLVTNSSALDRPEVQEALQLFTRQDEIWTKLDAGTEDYLGRVNRTEVPLEKILSNILQTARKRPVVIQSLFAAIDGAEPGVTEIDAYADRLAELVRQGARISLVQIYSATRPMFHQVSAHLSLRRLSQIAQTVRVRTGLTVEIF